ncbi:MAG: efflux RND transporter periplasmic adaptor subunit [Deltaproteobacteria bacterium]|nr:efflux RND transporter periplasmic adaptor subunit [Deltaproteobacteria bacterium]
MGDRLVIPKLARRARLRRVVWVIVFLGAAAGVAYYLFPESVTGETYRTAAVTRRTIVRLVEATGHLDVRRRVEVPAPIPGRLVEILAAPRSTVRRGELLARLDDRAAALAVKGAQATVQAAAGRVAEARAALDAAAEERGRVERLVGRGLASQQELSSARAAVQRAEAALQAARAEQAAASGGVASAQLGRNLGDIVAPADGVVLVAPERLGAAVGPERGALFVIGEALDVMRIDATVGEADIGEIRPGQATRFEVQAFPGRSFDATVDRIGLEPQREGGLVMYPVTLHAQNSDGSLLPGMTAAVHFEVARHRDVLAVREAALRFAPEDAPPAPARSRIWRRMSRSRLEPVPVRVGISDGAYTEVEPTQGQLAVGDRIAIGLSRPGGSSERSPGITLGKR